MGGGGGGDSVGRWVSEYKTTCLGTSTSSQRMTTNGWKKWKGIVVDSGVIGDVKFLTKHFMTGDLFMALGGVLYVWLHLPSTHTYNHTSIHARV